MPLGLTEIENLHHVRVVDERRGSGFPGQVFAFHGVVLERNFKGFEGDRAIQIDIDSGVNCSHASLSEQRKNTEVIEEGPGLE